MKQFVIADNLSELSFFLLDQSRIHIFKTTLPCGLKLSKMVPKLQKLQNILVSEEHIITKVFLNDILTKNWPHYATDWLGITHPCETLLYICYFVISLLQYNMQIGSENIGA